MSDSIPPTLRALVWSFAFAGTGAFLGSAVDRVMTRALADSKHAPEVRLVAHFSVAILALGQITQQLIPSGAESPIGDGILMFFFFMQQPHFREMLSDFVDKVWTPYLPYHADPAK